MSNSQLTSAPLGCVSAQVQSRGLTTIFDKVDNVVDKITGRSDDDPAKPGEQAVNEEPKKEEDSGEKSESRFSF